jgi:flagellar biosynthetic protein FliQ
MQLLWKAALISAPLLLTVLLVGVLVSVLQVITQIQEMSLTFIPKLIAAIAVIGVTGPWMLRELASFSTELINSIPSRF